MDEAYSLVFLLRPAGAGLPRSGLPDFGVQEAVEPTHCRTEAGEDQEDAAHQLQVETEKQQGTAP